MVGIAPMYRHLMSWKGERKIIGKNEFNQPIYDEGEDFELIGRYELFKHGHSKEFLGEDGVSVLQSNGVFYAPKGSVVPKRFDIAYINDIKYQILHVYDIAYYNVTIYLKEVK